MKTAPALKSGKSPRLLNKTDFLIFLFCLTIAKTVFCESVNQNITNTDGIKKLTENLFPEKKAKPAPACKVLDRATLSKLKETELGLSLFTQNLVKYLNENNEKQFEELFHPRLRNKSENLGTKFFASLRHGYIKPWQFSIYRIFSLFTVNGDKQDIECPEENIMITSVYGYHLQIGLWVQLMSQNELARIYFPIVPAKDKWYLGGVHIQQWTFKEKDYEKWVKEASGSLEKGDRLGAFLRLDVAQKMLFGGNFISFKVKNQIITARDESYKKEDLLKEVSSLIKSSNIVYIGTILGNDGIGLIIREKIEKDYTTAELEKKCLEMGYALIDGHILKPGLGGIKCDFIFEGEDPGRDGQLGGFYKSRNELLSKRK
ncbi:MAG: hypothetical protein HQK54_16390 [Oligoflexales bacterium]|nr:hypothetical protein [Oligoflexales bacterium]